MKVKDLIALLSKLDSDSTISKLDYEERRIYESIGISTYEEADEFIKETIDARVSNEAKKTDYYII
jgi:pilus assembly protein TadC